MDRLLFQILKMKKTEEKKKKAKKSEQEKIDVKIPTIMYSALIIIFSFIILIGIVIYGFGKEYGFIKKTERIIPYPVAIIEKFNFISISELNENLDSVKKFYESQDFSQIEMRVDFSTESGKKRLKMKEKEVLNKMIEDKSVYFLAKKRGITITQEMVDQYLGRKLEEYGSAEKLKSNLENLYGWTVTDFKNKIIKPDLYKQELEKAFLTEDDSAKKSEEQIKKAKEKLDEKESFADVAKEYSKGSTASKGGELGWFKKDQLISEISNVAFSLEKGKRSEVLESPLGFHIVEVEDKKTENGQDLVRIRQIFTPKKTFAEFLTEEMKKMNFSILIKDYYWDKEKARVEFKNQEMKDFEKEVIENSQGDISVIF